MGNPYASLQVDDFEPETEAVTATAPVALALAPTNDTLIRRYVRISQDPYAALAFADDEDAVAQQPVAALSSKLARCEYRKISSGRRPAAFLRFILAAENGVLRSHHRDFIVRNENRSGEARARLIDQLSRYDLTDLPLHGHFNRERDPFTIGKLSQIEKAALGTSKS